MRVKQGSIQPCRSASVAAKAAAFGHVLDGDGERGLSGRVVSELVCGLTDRRLGSASHLKTDQLDPPPPRWSMIV